MFYIILYYNYDINYIFMFSKNITSKLGFCKSIF